MRDLLLKHNIVLCTTTSDIIWLRRLLAELGVPLSQPTKLFCDNVSALALTNPAIFYDRTKNIEINFHFIRDCIRLQHISIHHIASQDQPTDLFTKSLSAHFSQLHDKLAIQLPFVNLKGADKQACKVTAVMDISVH